MLQDRLVQRWQRKHIAQATEMVFVHVDHRSVTGPSLCRQQGLQFSCLLQVAKAAGCHIIALCSNDIKAAMLKRLGADRVVDYKREDLGAILRREYPKVYFLS